MDRTDGFGLKNLAQNTANLVIVVFCLAALQGCGPDRSNDPTSMFSVKEVLERIEINIPLKEAILPQREAILRDQLQRLMLPKGVQEPLLYTLTVDLSSAAVTRPSSDSSVHSWEITLEADYKLAAKDTGQVVWKDKILQLTLYHVLLSAEPPEKGSLSVAQEKALRQLAGTIMENIEAYLARQQK